MSPMKILHVTPGYKPAFIYGGPIISVSGLCEKIAEYGNEVTVLTTTANGTGDLPTHTRIPKHVEGVDVFYFKRWTKGNSHFTPSLLYRLLKDVKKYDVVHIHTWWNLVVLPALLICILRGVRPILSIRGTMSAFTFDEKSNSPKALFHRFIGKYMIRKTVIHVTSEKEQVECQEKIGDFQSFNLPNYINLQDAEAAQETRTDAVFTMVMLSRIHPVKNIELVLDCLSEVTFDFRLVIIGKGEKEYVERLKNMAKEKKIADNIEWLGARRGKDKFQLLASADLFVQMSLTENFGNSIIEAAAVGTPVLISETVGAADYVKRLELGRIVPLDKEIVIKTLSDVFSSPRDGIKMKKERKEAVLREFYSKQLYSKYMEQYKIYFEEH